MPRCLVGMEACSSAHHWARELMALGHEVRLIPPQYAKPYVKRNKTDAADAEAICEAVGRPNMRFVPVKSKESQGLLTLHRVRALLLAGVRAAVMWRQMGGKRRHILFKRKAILHSAKMALRLIN